MVWGVILLVGYGSKLYLGDVLTTIIYYYL